MAKKGVPKRDSSGKGRRANKGRGGCKTPRTKGKKPKGWEDEPARHSLAAHGVRTKDPTYAGLFKGNVRDIKRDTKKMFANGLEFEERASEFAEKRAVIDAWKRTVPIGAPYPRSHTLQEAADIAEKTGLPVDDVDSTISTYEWFREKIREGRGVVDTSDFDEEEDEAWNDMSVIDLQTGR